MIVIFADLINKKLKGDFMSTAAKGDNVKVHYTGKLDDGSVFDSSKNREPLEFKLGQAQVIPGFENAVLGLKEGESTNISIPPTEAYGEVNQKLIYEIPKEKLPQNAKPEVGMRLESVQEDGRRIPLVITSIQQETVTLDANHPLAGKQLHFEIELVEVKKSA